MRLRLKNHGFTLLELMITAAIMIIVLTGLLATYVTCLELNETAKNSNLALNAAQDIMERIRSSPDLSTIMNYNASPYNITSLPANSGLVYVHIDNISADLLNVSVGACWEQKRSRIIGECQDIGGIVTFSDNNGNQVLDSPVQLNSLMAQR